MGSPRLHVDCFDVKLATLTWQVVDYFGVPLEVPETLKHNRSSPVQGRTPRSKSSGLLQQSKERCVISLNRI